MAFEVAEEPCVVLGNAGVAMPVRTLTEARQEAGILQVRMVFLEQQIKKLRGLNAQVYFPERLRLLVQTVEELEIEREEVLREMFQIQGESSGAETRARALVWPEAEALCRHTGHFSVGVVAEARARVWARCPRKGGV